VTTDVLCARCGALLSDAAAGPLVALGLAHAPDGTCRVTRAEVRAAAEALEAEFQAAIAPQVARLEREVAAALREAKAAAGTPWHPTEKT
jgi:hypothetical protein